MAKKKKMSLQSTTDDLMLYADVYVPESEPKAVVQIIHGKAEHKERYEVIANILSAYGCVVLVVDNRGHGESISDNVPLGYFADENGWLVNLQDIQQFSTKIMEKYRNLPFFIIGHGMGALIGHSFLKRYEDMVSGAVFSGMPAFVSTASANKKKAATICKLKGAKNTTKQLNTNEFNNSIVNPRTPFDWISYNVDNVDSYMDDDLCGFDFTNKGWYDYYDGMMDVFSRSDWRILKKQLPILFVVGQQDVCADVAVGFNNSLNNLANAGYEKIEANIYENMRHEVFNEREKKIVFKDVLTWLNKQLQNEK